MHQALLLKQPEGVHIPNERTVYRSGPAHRPKRKPNGIIKADREAMKSDDLLKQDFNSDAPLKKYVTDIPELKASDGKLYVSAIFDCFRCRRPGTYYRYEHESGVVCLYAGERCHRIPLLERRDHPQ